MQLKTILNHLESYQGFIFKNAQFCPSYDKWSFRKDSIVVEIIPRKNSQPKCSRCGVKSAAYDRLDIRLFDYIPLWGIAVYFAYQMRRVNCPLCGVKVESVPWATGKSQLTHSFAWYLSHWAKVLSWKEVSKQFHVSWDTVFKAVSNAVDWGLKNRDLSNIKSIGVDEVARAKGHKYLTLVYQIDQGCKRLLWIGNDRKEETFQKFFDWLGEDKSKKITAVCSDMWKAYLKVIKQRIPDALHVLDRFHIVAHLNKAVDKVRAEEHKRLIKDGYEAVLTKSRWLLLHHRKNLKQDKEVTLKELLKYNLKTMKAYLLKEEFQNLWEYSSPVWAGKFLDNWCKRVMKSSK